MKANEDQYKKAYKIYQKSKHPMTEVFAFADSLGIDEWSVCSACETNTPDCEDGSCLVCATFKEFNF